MALVLKDRDALDKYCKREGLDTIQGPSVAVCEEGLYEKLYLVKNDLIVGQAVRYPEGWEIMRS